MAQVKLEHQHVTVGQPLPFDLLDEHGRVLLMHGFLIRTSDQLDRLIERGVLFNQETEAMPQSQPAVASVFNRIGELACCFDALMSKTIPDYGAALNIAVSIQELCEQDGDAALANILLHKSGRYSLRHSFHSAVITEILLSHLARPAEIRRFAVAGALTMNVGMLDLQDILYRQDAPLTVEQKRAIVVHPQMALKALREAGIDHPVWLDVVEHHHEMIDGTGYAKRLHRDDLSIESQAVSLADRFCTLVLEREFRAGMLPSQAVKDLLGRQSATVEPTLAAAFVKEVGSFPPGTVVALVNGEVGVVVRRLLNAAQPMVRGLRSANGINYPEPPKRLTSKLNYEIKEALGADIVKNHDLTSLWGLIQPDEMPQRAI